MESGFRVTRVCDPEVATLAKGMRIVVSDKISCVYASSSFSFLINDLWLESGGIGS